MTAQEVFDTVVRHLHTQGKQAYDDGGCRYRTDDGLRCAVGCLISDEEYVLNMEGNTVALLLDEGLATPVMQEHYDLLRELQDVHDDDENWTSRERMGVMLGNVAKRMLLDSSLVKELYGVS